MQRTQPISIREALSFGFQEMQRHLALFTGLFFISAILTLATNVFPTGRAPTGLLLALVGKLVQVALTAGWIRVCLKLEAGQEAHLSDLVPTLPQFLSLLAATILYSIVVTVGLLLLLVPGIYLAIRYGAYGFLIVDRGLDPIPGLRESAKLTEGARWDLLAFGLVATGLNLLGMLALGVGLLFTLPVTGLASARIYRRLTERRIVPRPLGAEEPAPTPA